MYVANIPYEYTNDDLKNLFSIFNPESAHIVPRPIPRYVVRKLAERGEARKGRGFGFVTFVDTETQTKAVAEMHGKDVNGREILVKVAIDKPDIATNGENEAETAAKEPVEAKSQ